MKIYTGIGSRETPDRIIHVMFTLARELARDDYTLRSGGANGADHAFETGCISVGGLKEIYLPWKGFNGNTSHFNTIGHTWAWDMAEKYHPAWDRLSLGVKRMMVRNCMQILGNNGDIPTDFVVCWTKDGKASGGTGHAIRIAEAYNIKVYNLFSTKDYTLLQDILLTQHNL